MRRASTESYERIEHLRDRLTFAQADLLVAAAAEKEGLTVLHYDSEYDTIAAVTGQPVEWVVPRGTV